MGNLPKSCRLEVDCSWLLSTKFIPWVHTLGLTGIVSKKLENRSQNIMLVHWGLSKLHPLTIDLVFVLVLADIAACILGSKASLELLTCHQMCYIKSGGLLEGHSTHNTNQKQPQCCPSPSHFSWDSLFLFGWCMYSLIWHRITQIILFLLPIPL